MAKAHEFQGDGSESDGLLWHYTSLRSLSSMISGEKVTPLDGSPSVHSYWWWATHYAYLNDSREVAYAFDVLKKALGRVELDKFADPGRQAEIGHMKEHLNQLPLASPDNLREGGPYVACFSKAGDSLSQWRAYGTAGATSCSIGIDPDALRATGLRLLEVKYLGESEGDARHQHQLREVLQEFVDLSEPERVDGGPGGPGSIGTKALRSTLRELSAKLKHPSFRDEHEVRLVEHDGNGYGVHYRHSSTFGLVPFVKVAFPDMKRAIRCIRTGPAPHPTETESAVRGWVDQAIGAHVEVCRSTSPYRSW